MRCMADKKEPKNKAGAEQDVLVFVGPMSREQVQKALALVKDCKARSAGLLLVLVTLGGSADAAYKLASTLRKLYGKITVFVPHMCKSAGTLVCLAADELVMSVDGELGPLDVQVVQDDRTKMHSGLDQSTSFSALIYHTRDAFSHYFRYCVTKLGLSKKSASEIASDLAGMTMAPIYSQIDPRVVGEIIRAMEVSYRYGNLLRTINVQPWTIKTLVDAFPSHGFVIDSKTASGLFKKLREPGEIEQQQVPATDLLEVLKNQRSIITFKQQEATK